MNYLIIPLFVMTFLVTSLQAMEPGGNRISSLQELSFDCFKNSHDACNYFVEELDFTQPIEFYASLMAAHRNSLPTHDLILHNLEEGFYSQAFPVQCLRTLSSDSQLYSELVALPNGRIAGGSVDAAIRIWDCETSECLQILHGHTDNISCLDVLSNGHLASGSHDSTIRIWDCETGECLQILHGHTSRIGQLVVLPNDYLASGSLDNTIRIWDPVTGECLHTLHGHDDGITKLIVLPNGCLASGSSDHTIRIWDTITGECLTILEGHSDWIISLVILPHSRLASASYDSTIRIWNYETGGYLRTLSDESVGQSPCIVGLADGNLVCGSRYSDTRLSYKSILQIWDPVTGETLNSMEGYTDGITRLIALPNGHFVSGSRDKKIRIWDPLADRCLNTLEGHTKAVSELVIVPNGRLASRSHDKMIQIWALYDPSVLSFVALILHFHLVQLYGFTYDEQFPDLINDMHPEWHDAYQELLAWKTASK